ncbi:MAG: T9SS type A sorting domain-containing protein, partial [Candidatus Cloacimonadota bacterium]|nr:T9SS type A sorting domain-containing protein [Candidatus Cloacimonadota bacterium]
KNHIIRGIDDHQTYSSNPENIILEYGKGYKVTFLPTSYTNHQDITSIDFNWGTETNTFDYRKKKETTYFTYNTESDYIAIDIVEFDNIDEVMEIGVFAGDKCIGASVADSLPLQILIYPDDDSKNNQGFELRTFDNNRSETIQKYLVYDDKINSFTSKPLTDDRDIYYVKVKKNNDNSIIESNFITSTNYPNPFNPSTIISFNIHENSNVKLEIYNLIGQKVKTIEEGYLVKGNHSYTWNGKNSKDEVVSSGVYFYKISANNNSVQSKILLIK